MEYHIIKGIFKPQWFSAISGLTQKNVFLQWMVSIGILVQDPHIEPFVVKEYIIGNLIRED